MCAYVAGELEDGSQIDLQYGFPVVVRELMGWVAPLDTTAVEQDVYSVAVFEDGGEEGGHGLFRGEVRGIDCGFAAERLNGLLGGLVGCVALSLGVSIDGFERLVHVERAHLNKKDVCSCFGEGNGH